MADRWQRPDYDSNRRGLYPNPTWQRERSPPRGPRRPAGPQRSYSGVDPGERPQNMDPRKRNPSRSPEGGQPRKQFKANQSNGSGTVQSTNNDSRRSSVSNGTSRQPSITSSEAANRRPSTQWPQDPRKDQDGFRDKSPNARGSTSRGSTPQRKASANTAVGTKPPGLAKAADVTMKDGGAMENPASILDLLSSFGSQVATQAALQIACDQAEARYKRAQLEYNENRKQFNHFPAIEERKTADKEAAQKEFAIKEQRLEEYKVSQSQLMGTLADLIGRAPSAESTDIVSRADYERLSTTCGELKAEVKVLKEDVKKVNNIVQDVHTHVVDVRKTAGQISNAQSQITKLHNVQVLPDDKFASKERLHELDTKYKKLDQDVAGVKKKHVELLKDVGTLRADKIASSVTRPANGNDIDDGFIKKDSPEVVGLIQDVQETRRKVDELRAFTRGADNEDVDAPLESRSLVEKLLEMSQQLDDVKDGLKDVTEQVHEEGKEPMVKRVKNLDKIVNNLASQVQNEERAPLSKRISQLEDKQLALQDDMKVARDAAQTQASTAVSSGAPIDTQIWQNRLKSIEDELENLTVQQDEKDAMVVEHIKSQMESVQELIRSMDNNSKQHNETVNGKLVLLEKTLEEVMKSMASMVSVNLLEASEGRVNRVIDDVQNKVKELEIQQEKARAVPQTPLPATQPYAAPPPQLPNGIGMSPPSQNGMMGSPSFNTGAPPRHSSAYGNGALQPTPVQPQELQRVQAQLDQLVAVTQHLRQRFDNLVTDDLARNMVDQMAQMYPHAKNVEVGMNESRRQESVLGERVDKLQGQVQDVNSAVANVQASSTSLKDAVEKATKMASDAESLAKTLSTDVGHLKENVSHLSTQAKNGAAASPTPSGTYATMKDVAAVRKEMEEISKTATAGEKLGKEHSSRFSKLAPETMKQDLDQLSLRLDAHDDTLLGGEQELKRFKKEVRKVKSEMDALKENVFECQGKVDAFEELMK